ncbi:hypothetical protein C8J57DRAFT_746134 [Mycena rebaudengoi]|nr:hypothetical protein C8J57DRAFT_746134 [Mycena rebaudengoi]
MSSTPREIGTLVVVILKANHLPNKRHIGKQDPYCSVAVNGEKQRTKIVKRGGQHPEWDEELRFTLYEDDVPTIGQDGTPPPLPPKDGKKNIKGGKIMKLSCFADDPREPDLIGQADVDLTEVLTKGETDDWFDLKNKDKFAGKVYLELTFWSNEAPPEKKVTPQPPKNNEEYGGQGSFTSSDDIRPMPSGGIPGSRITSTSSFHAHSRRQSDSGSVSSSLRTSTSLAQLDLYMPPYEQQHRSRVASFSAVTNDFGELGLGSTRRRESFPPPQESIYGHRPPTTAGFSTYPPAHGYEPTASDAASMYSYERPVTPPGQSADPSGFGRPVPYTPQAPYRQQYDSGSVYHPSSIRGPRYSMPTTSSGFMPLANPSTFPSHPSDPSGFAPPVSHTPLPMGYSPSHIPPQPSYPPVLSQTGPGYVPPLPPSSSASFHPQQGFPPSQSFQYSQFQPQPPPQQYNAPPQTHMQNPTPPAQQAYPLPPSPTNKPATSLSHSTSVSSSTGSRPLPLQPQPYPQQNQQPYGLPPSSSQPHTGSYSPTPVNGSTFPDTYQPSPPPPPPPPHQNAGHQSYTHNDPNILYQPPPPPAPPSHVNTASPRRHSSLPQPPSHLQHSNYSVLPPPPPPPLEYSLNNPPPPPPPLPSHVAVQAQPYYPGPPPRPPVQADGQSQWTQSQQPLQNGYSHQGWN